MRRYADPKTAADQWRFRDTVCKSGKAALFSERTQKLSAKRAFKFRVGTANEFYADLITSSPYDLAPAHQTRPERQIEDHRKVALCRKPRPGEGHVQKRACHRAAGHDGQRTVLSPGNLPLVRHPPTLAQVL